MRRFHLIDAFLQRISGLLAKDEEAVLGVSGGVDSMVLMHLLGKGWKIQAAHLNHKLRGKSSDADERLVRRMAKKLGLPCHVESVDVKAVARAEGVSIEMAARKCRHEFFARLARKVGVRKIALAHHADDQVELFFLRLLRGAGPEGLAGMAEMSPSPVDPSLTIIRPLLTVTKAELRDYAARHKIPFREDATNASTSILRNRIRHKLIPLLAKDYQPGLVQNVLRLMELLKEESDFVASEAARARARFDKLPIALQRRRLREQLYAAGIEANFDLVERLRLNPGTPVSFASQRLVARDAAGALVLSDVLPTGMSAIRQTKKSALLWSADSLRVDIAKAGSANFGGVAIQWSIDDCKAKPAKDREYFDADKIGPRITLRHWRAGDRFRPIGMMASVKLQDIFSNLKVPRDRRHRLVVAATARGDVFWVEGLRIGDPFKIEPSTKRRLQWSWRRHGTC